MKNSAFSVKKHFLSRNDTQLQFQKYVQEVRLLEWRAYCLFNPCACMRKLSVEGVVFRLVG